MAWWRDEQTRDDIAGWIEFAETAWHGGSMFAFSILDHDGRYLGACSLEGVSQHTRSANLSYWVRTGATGRGVARTAARALARWGCLDKGLRRVEISVVRSNTASIATARGSGAHYEGCLRNKAMWAGNSYDMEVFSFVPDDFR
jgi:RimJ/RimL family protein N-acetyltransferase